MLKEIYEQPKLLRNFLNFYDQGPGKEILKQLKGADISKVHIAACGTAWHAGLLIKKYLELFNEFNVEVDLASEFRYRDPRLNRQDLGLFISQSGETADTLAAQELCQEKGLETFSIINVEASTLYRKCNKNFLIKAGTEIGVASTKAFTLQVLTGLLIAKGLKGEIVDQEIRKRIILLADRIDSLLQNPEKINEIAKEIYGKKGFIFIGRGENYPIALEGALKLKEIAYVHAEGFAAGELKHGPIALVDEEMVCVALVGTRFQEKMLSNVEEIKARRGIIVVVGPYGQEFEKVGDYFIPLNLADLGELTPLLTNVVLQLLAYFLARFKGTDIDRPRNLAKSVTVE